MTDDLLTDELPAVVLEPDAPAAAFTGVQVEIVMDGHRVIGELRAGGVPRRLVDILNSIDSGAVTLVDGLLDDPFSRGEPLRFARGQLDRDAILFIMPRQQVQVVANPFEVVKKAPVPATIALPGFQVSGDVHLMPHADPASVPIIGTRHFIPLTEATVTPSEGRDHVWREPLVIVNLGRALLYAPKSRR